MDACYPLYLEHPSMQGYTSMTKFILETDGVDIKNKEDLEHYTVNSDYVLPVISDFLTCYEKTLDISRSE